MHDRIRRLVAAGMTGLLLAAALAVPADAGSPRPAQVRKAEPRRVVEYRPNRPFTHDTDLLSVSGDPAAIGRSVPAIALFSSSATGGATLTRLRAPDLRDASLFSPEPTTASAPVAGPPMPPSPGVASVSVMQADAAYEVAIGFVPGPASTALALPAEPPPAPPSVLVRTLSTLPANAVDPTASLLPGPGDLATDAPRTLMVAGVPAGIRLVVVALVPDGGSVADPTTLRVAWVPVADPGTNPMPR